VKKVTFGLQMQDKVHEWRVPTEGYGFTHSGVELVVHELDAVGWQVSEPVTGKYVVRYCKTRKEAIAGAKERLDQPVLLARALKLIERGRK